MFKPEQMTNDELRSEFVLRIEQGEFTLADLARRADVSYFTLRKFVRGEVHTPRSALRNALVDFLRGDRDDPVGQRIADLRIERREVTSRLNEIDGQIKELEATFRSKTAA